MLKINKNLEVKFDYTILSVNLASYFKMKNIKKNLFNIKKLYNNNKKIEIKNKFLSIIIKFKKPYYHIIIYNCLIQWINFK